VEWLRLLHPFDCKGTNVSDVNPVPYGSDAYGGVPFDYDKVPAVRGETPVGVPYISWTDEVDVTALDATVPEVALADASPRKRQVKVNG